MRKGVFIPDITVEMFKNATLESVEEFMTSGQMEDIEIPSWIPIVTRPMTEEEYEEFCESHDWYLEESDRLYFIGQMPEDGQDILISTQYGVTFDTCLYDPEFGYGLEQHDDWNNVLAWMPLPKPYVKEGEADGE